MKLKTVTIDGKTYAELSEDRPIYVSDDGRETPVDVPATVATISRLNAEAKGHREAKEAAEAKLKAFDGIEDGEAARKALELAKNIKDGELIAAGKVEEIKAAAKRAAEEQVAAQARAHGEELSKLRGDYDALTSRYHGEKIGGAFTGSKFIAEKASIPADMMQARFGQAFKVEDGKLIAYDSAGNKIFSRSRPGDVADFDEAVEVLVEAYPYKDHILKGNNNGGGGSRGNGAGGGKTIARAAFESLDPVARATAIKDGMTVTD